MTRAEVLLKLLAIEPETRDQIRLQCGWPHGEADEVLTGLLCAGLVTGKNCRNARWYRPTKRALIALGEPAA